MKAVTGVKWEGALAEVTVEVAKFIKGEIEKAYPMSQGETKRRKRKPMQ